MIYPDFTQCPDIVIGKDIAFIIPEYVYIFILLFFLLISITIGILIGYKVKKLKIQNDINLGNKHFYTNSGLFYSSDEIYKSKINGRWIPFEEYERIFIILNKFERLVTAKKVIKAIKEELEK